MAGPSVYSMPECISYCIPCGRLTPKAECHFATSQPLVLKISSNWNLYYGIQGS